MAVEIQSGETFTDVAPGKSVTSTRLNNMFTSAVAQPGLITNRTDVSTAIASDDTLLIYDQSASGLKKVQAQYLLPPEVITAKTDLSTTIAAADLLLVADASASNALMKVQAQNLLPAEAITNKTSISTTLAQDDVVLVSDTSDSGALKKATVASLHPTGSVVQTVSTSDAAVTSVSASIPADDTIPQSSEGTQILSLAITPTSSSNILEIEVVVPVGFSTSTAIGVAALFQDSTANALLAVAVATDTGDAAGKQMVMQHRMTAGTTSSTTFKVRLGTNTGNVHVNANGSGTRYFGGVSVSRITIREIKA